MRSGIAQGGDDAPGVTRRVVRLLVLLGVAVAVYLALSLFDHAARADAGSVDPPIGATDPVDSVEATAAGAKKAIPKPRSPKTHPKTIHRPTIKTPQVHRAKVQTPKKVHAPKIQGPRKIHAPSVRTSAATGRVQARTSKLRKPTSDAVRDAARASGTRVRTAVVRLKLPTLAALPSLSELAELPGLTQAELPASPQLPSWQHLSGMPQTQLPAWPQRLQLPSLPQARTPALSRSTASLDAPVPHQPFMPPVSAQAYPLPLPQPPALAPAPGLSGVTKPPTAQAQSRTAPLPAPPRQPADRSTPTGQARDSGGGNAPATGTVSSSWRPEVTAGGRTLSTDLLAGGRTVRYAGPPS
jgi:hypothetical protein